MKWNAAREVKRKICAEKPKAPRTRCVAIWQLHSNTADSVIQRRKWICSLAPNTNGLKFRGRQILDQLKKECSKQLNSPNMECTVRSCDCVTLGVFKQSWDGPLVTPFHREECVLRNLSLILIPGLQQGSGIWSSPFSNLCWVYSLTFLAILLNKTPTYYICVCFTGKHKC